MLFVLVVFVRKRNEGISAISLEIIFQLFRWTRKKPGFQPQGFDKHLWSLKRNDWDHCPNRNPARQRFTYHRDWKRGSSLESYRGKYLERQQLVFTSPVSDSVLYMSTSTVEIQYQTAKNNKQFKSAKAEIAKKIICTNLYLVSFNRWLSVLVLFGVASSFFHIFMVTLDFGWGKVKSS